MDLEKAGRLADWMEKKSVAQMVVVWVVHSESWWVVEKVVQKGYNLVVNLGSLKAVEMVAKSAVLLAELRDTLMVAMRVLVMVGWLVGQLVSIKGHRWVVL